MTISWTWRRKKITSQYQLLGMQRLQLRPDFVMNSLGAAIDQFGFDLFKELRKTNDGNILFSPVGISTALGMLLLGAQGSTAWQLQQVFHFEKDTEISRIKAEEKEKYLDYVEKYYHASLEPVDFINATEESQKKINSWVESQTHEKIKDLLPDGSLSSATKLVLVNTVYFRGQWDAEFKKENTKEEEFWLNKDTSKSVPMMKQYHSFHFTSLEDLQAKILGIPYKGNDLSMFVLLPNDIDGLEKIIDEITPGKLIEWTSPGHMEEKNVNLHFPRFHVEESYELEAVLPAMGMADAFNEHTADFSGMSSRSGLHAQKFLHRSLIVATEEGTEATAATGMGLVNTSGRDHENFHCNHPFLFFIKQSGADSILFFGRFSSP
ncbi:serpin B13-like isoform X4 [Tamandua tetradactyla]|uniref:serpin B13-like isoform X4 n=1 Tax=Tamandua tetradactyla TaxID=48850 RepID=UPI004053F4AC